MKNKIKLSDFTFVFNSYGHYKVTYTSPITNKSWTSLISDMTIIDDTKNADYPKVKDLNHLKQICKAHE